MARQIVINGAVVKERHPFAPLGLSIITLGIYAYVWWYKINSETRDMGQTVSPGVSVLALIPGAILIIPPFATIWTTADRISRVQEKAGVNKAISPGIAILLAIIPIVNLFFGAYIQSGLNRAWDRLSAPTPPAPAAPAPPS